MLKAPNSYCYCCWVLQSCPTLCDPIDGSPPGSRVPGILQARTLEWVVISFPNVWKWKWSRSFVSDCDPMYCGLPASSTHGIFQARVLEWVAIVFSLLIVSKTETQTITMSVPSLPCIRLVKFERIITVTVGGEINTHNLVVYLTYMQSTSWEMLGWKKHKLESRLLGEISITSDMQMIPPLWQKVKKN